MSRVIHVEPLCGGEQIVLGVLVEDVVDDLHGVDLARLERLQHVGRLPAVDADAEALDLPLALQIFRCPLPALVGGPRVVPDVQLLEVQALHAEVLQALFRHLDDVAVGEDLTDRRVGGAGPLTILRRHLGGDVQPAPGVGAQRLRQQLLAVAFAIRISGVEEVHAAGNRLVQRRQRLRIVAARPAAHAPHAVADLRDLPAKPSEPSRAHGRHRRSEGRDGSPSRP
jgi:hypothetical protein